MTSSLPELVYLICSGGVISEQAVADCLAKIYGHPLPHEEGVERLLSELGFNEALERLIDSNDALLSLVQAVNPLCTAIKSKAEGIEVLLQGLQLSPPQEARYSLGAATIEQKLSQVLYNLKKSVRTNRWDQEKVRRKPIDAWAYVEHVLKSTIDFYASNLLGIDSTADEEFRAAKEKHSLGPIFKAISSIEKHFLPKEDTFGNTIYYPRDLIEQSQRLFGRKSPFAGFNVWKYRNAIRAYRNDFAHKTAEVIDSKGIELILKSLEATYGLIQDLIELNIAPSIIYVIAHGYDEYGRGVVWFVEEQYIALGTSERYDKELRMFKAEPEKYEKLKPYMTITWPKDRMYDPPLTPLHIERGALPDATI
jgi:hypothetical protein